MKINTELLIYWLVATTPLIIFFLGPITWPISITDSLLNNSLLAFGIVASTKLVWHYNKITGLFISSFMCGVYLSIIGYALYSKFVLNTFA